MLTAGIDVGSRTIKAVVLDDDKWLASKIMDTGANSARRAREIILMLMDENDINWEGFDNIIATGYGRISVEFASERITEITCHAVGAYSEFPETGTIIDIGGQDSKVIRLDNKGKVEDFVMNDKCAAGTGRFLEVMAENLEVPLDRIGSVSLGAKKGATISSTCTVFAESEVISLVAEGVEKSRILKGIHTAIVKRISSMVHKLGLKEEVTLTGGVCLNRGVRQELQNELNVKVNKPEFPQLAGAYGAARLAQIKVR
ncbi:MAG: acyl-CoA dehydratase activase [Halanaerobiaceae bacterium]